MRTPSSRRPKNLQTTLVAEMRARLVEDDSEPPQTDGPWAYYHALSNGRAASPRLPSPARRRRGNDPSRRRCAGRGQSLLQPRSGAPFARSRKARLGRRRPRLGAHDDSRPRPRALARTSTTASSTLAPTSSGRANSTGFLYIEQDDNHRPFRVMLHRLGTDQGDDVEVFAEPDPAWFIGVSGSLNGRTRDDRRPRP